jgi:RNA-directed DNA polymerase
MKFDLKHYLNDLPLTPRGLSVKLKNATSEETRNFTKLERDAAALLSIQDVYAFCPYVKVPFHEIEQCINQPRYNEILVSKQGGKGKRLIQEPSMSLKRIHRKLNRGLGAVYTLVRPEQAHGFVRSKKDASIGIVSNAAVHAGSAFVLNMDLKDFFHTISVKQVKKVLSSEIFLFNDHLSTAIALLVTYQGRLPQGAATSPVLSNFVCLSLDERLRFLAINNGWKFTRYADDLTFSGPVSFSDEDLVRICEVVESEGFTMNERKTRRKGSCRKQKVTGLIVNEKVNVDRRLIRKVRAMLHDARMNGLNAAALRHFKNPVPNPESRYLNRLQGYISFIGMVRGKEDLLFVRQKAELKGLMNNTSSCE